MAVLAVVGMCARLLAQFALGFYVAPEAWEYDTLARNLVAGRGYVIERYGIDFLAFTFPVYPLMLAAVYAVFGSSPIGVGVFQAALGGALTGLTYLFALRMGRPAAVLAALAVATHPGLLVYAAKIHALNLHAVLALIAALIARAVWERPQARRAILASIGSGVMALERTTLVPTLGLALAIAGWRRNGLLGASRYVLGWILITSLILAPWIARNAIVLGEPVLTTTGNENLWRGNNPASTSGNVTLDGRPMLETSPELRDRVVGRSELEQSAIFGTEALDYMLADPLATIRRTLAKLSFFWWFGPTAGLNYPAGWLAVYAGYYVALVAAGLVGAAHMIRSGAISSLAAIAMTLLPVSLVQALYYVEGRHRWAVEPLMLVMAAVGLTTLTSLLRRFRFLGAARSRADDPVRSRSEG